MKQDKTYQNSDFLLEVIHNFVRFTASSENNQDVFWAVTKNFMETLNIEDCVVYEASALDRKIIQRAAHGAKNPNGEMINNLLELDYGVGIAGWVAEHQETVLVSDTRQDPRYLVDDEERLSELCVPICFNGELFGVISSENSAENFFTERHVQLFELIADLAANLLVRIRQKEELARLKEELERILDKKKRDLEEVIETVSDQVSELKHQRDKGEILLREVHHRVNNNLQILHSVVNLYLIESPEITRETLVEIKGKIQILSAIHLILFKSVENKKQTLNDFLLDLIASIRYMNSDNYLNAHTGTKLIGMSLNTLIPLGLLIHEIITSSIQTYWKKGSPVELVLHLDRNNDESYILELNATHEISASKAKQQNTVSQTLIEAYIDQLEGEVLKPSADFGIWKIRFKEQL